MAETSIEWTDRVWNCLRGCSRVSRGCGDGAGGGCYAERMAHRFSGEGMPYEGLTRLTAGGPRWTGEVRTVPELLAEPLRWRKPQRVFVNSMSDLFHEKVPGQFIAAVFGVMAACPHLTFQVLTKRPERARAWFAEDWNVQALACAHLDRIGFDRGCGSAFEPDEWPLPNVWLGVSVEDQRAADERIPHLLATPAAVRFLSCEPLLGPVDLRHIWPGGGTAGIVSDALTGKAFTEDEDMRTSRIDWVIVGGESGPGARPCDVTWVRSLVEQCRAAGVSAFVKQLGAAPVSLCTCGHERAGHLEKLPAPCTHGQTDPACMDPDDPAYGCRCIGFSPEVILRDRKGGDPAEWPEDLRVREMPR